MEPKLIEALRFLARLAAFVLIVVGAYVGLINHSYQIAEYYLVLAIALRLL
jgi:hypothetical protein